MQKSIFGTQVEALQVLLDTRAEQFNDVWYKKHFTWDLPQVGLTFSAVLGASIIKAAASVVARDAETPLRARQALSVINGEIPAIKEMLPLNENQLREFMGLSAMSNITPEQKKNQALKLIWDDANTVVASIHNRLNFMAIQAVSKGSITLDTDTNPDGIVVEIPLGLLPANQHETAISWDTPETATPLQDIMGIIRGANGSVGKILMDQSKYFEMMATQEVKDTLGSFFGLTKTSSNSATAPLTLGRLNQYMEESGFPLIEVLNEKTAVEKNGVAVMVNPFVAGNVSFVPAGDLGVIKNAFAIEELSPVDQVTYAVAERVLVSKWKRNEPFREFTKAECNAFPVVNVIEGIHILDTTVTA